MNTDFNQFLVFRYILACLSSVVRKMTAYQVNNYDVNAFVELFDNVGALFCLIVAKLFMLKVHTKCAPWWHIVCHGVLI